MSDGSEVGAGSAMTPPTIMSCTFNFHFDSNDYDYYKRRKTTPPEIAPINTITINALITGLRSSGEPEKYEIAPLETVFIKAAIITDIRSPKPIQICA